MKSPVVTSNKSLDKCLEGIKHHLEEAQGCLVDAYPHTLIKGLPSDLWSPYATIQAGAYARHVLYRNEHIEAVLLAWGAQVTTKIHDHPQLGCLMRILHGTLTEKRYDHELNPTTENKLTAPNVSYIDNTLGYHRILNPKKTPAYSLHIYHPPNHKIREWDVVD